MDNHSNKFEEEEINILNGHCVIDALANVTNVTENKLLKCFATSSAESHNLVQQELKRILDSGVSNGFIVKKGNKYELPRVENAYQVDADGGDEDEENNDDDDDGLEDIEEEEEEVGRSRTSRATTSTGRRGIKSGKITKRRKTQVFTPAKKSVILNEFIVPENSIEAVYAAVLRQTDRRRNDYVAPLAPPAAKKSKKTTQPATRFRSRQKKNNSRPPPQGRR